MQKNLPITLLLGLWLPIACVGGAQPTHLSGSLSVDVTPGQNSGGQNSGGNNTPDASNQPTCVPGEPNSIVQGAMLTAVVTTADGNQLLAAQPNSWFAGQPCAADNASDANSASIIVLDTNTLYQPIDGFGAAFTDASARLMSTYGHQDTQGTLTQALFSPTAGINLTLLHMDIGPGEFGSNGLANYDNTYDPNLSMFSMGGAEDHYTFGVLGGMRKFNSNIRLMVAPWSAPPWMKTNNSMVGGSLDGNYASTMAAYMRLFVLGYQAAGNTFFSIATQNEPERAGDANGMSFPSSVITPSGEANFIANDLGALFRQDFPDIKILTYEAGWSDPNYPLAVASNPQAHVYTAGTAFHCDDTGDPAVQDLIPAAYPDQNVWLTRCGRTYETSFAEDLEWYGIHFAVGAFSHGARAGLMYNLALNQNDGRTNGGCLNCRGVVEINEYVTPMVVTYNVEYYILGHLAKFVQLGAHRIASTASNTAGIYQVAFLNISGSRVLFVLNTNEQATSISIRDGAFLAPATLPAHAAATFFWQAQPSSS